MDAFGCGRCFQASAEEADDARHHFAELALLVDDSHRIVRILQCPHCGQRCFSVFTEEIDWNDGDDAQYWSLLPVTEEESARLIAQGEDVKIQSIGPFNTARRCLNIDHPTGGPRRVFWVNPTP